ncbi:hypothetical protein [Flavihumibacter sp. ZG627]|uniref:hypothetical protein n=1 Tax=Flavihumibacter sp. ZG627 TaxID=1463156 RepID=UPI000693D2AE|nr:hypothetical protein [Flavihumibacter sp. ZG627]
MKKLFIAASALSALFAASCSKQQDVELKKELIPGTASTPDTLVGDITVNTTVTKTTYLKGIVYVKPGATLTVNPGVTIIGSAGAATPDLLNLANNKGVLVVEKGGKLVANGTPSSPIVWTSSKAAGQRNFGDWGGIVIFGQAPIITRTGAATNIYEAFDAINDPKNYYGGTNPSDNSGSMTYNRIEFAGGTVLAANKEVNGLTLCGVGSGTVINHVQVAHSGDDAFEFFGGTVNASHLLAFGSKDDDFDFDEAYSGRLQFIIAYRTDLADNSGSEMIELDNNATTTVFNNTRTNPLIVNATLIGPASTTVRSGVTGSFDGGVYVRKQGRIALANSLIIAQALPVALGTTATTNASFVNPSDPVPSFVRNNIFQTSSANPVVIDSDESNPIIGTADNALIAVLANSTNQNGALPNFAAFKLDGGLKPTAGSPALSGGLNVSSFGFVGTTVRGAVLPTDPWTTTGSWISIAAN